MRKFLILLGGALTVTRRLLRQIEGARVIAADSGIRHARALNVIPELWVGDFDSASDELFREFSEVEQIAYPEDKDLTDGEIAMTKALEMGATKLIVAGAFGGDRADHGFAILASAITFGSAVDSIILTSGTEEAVPLMAGREYGSDLKPGTLFSILAFSDLHKLSLKGAKWELRDRDVPFGSSLVISNTVDTTLIVKHDGGRCLLYAQIAGN